MNACCTKFQGLCDTVRTIANRGQCPLLLVLRLFFGLNFALAGWGKLMNLERTAGFFGSINIPAPYLNAILAGGTEFIGGLLLAVGLCSRLAALPLSFTMVVAFATAHAEELAALFSEPSQFVTASPFPYLLTCLLVLCFGPGRLSLDYLIKRRCCATSGDSCCNV